MPTYEYECTRCGAVVELFQSITEAARRKLKKTDPHGCECGAPVQRRIGTGAGIIFKGSGFYQTDYRSESYKNAAKADKDSAGGKEKADSTSSGAEKSDAGTTEKKESSTSSDGKSAVTKANDGSPAPKTKGKTGTSAT